MELKSGTPHVAILGAGPAGLGAAYRLARRGCFEVSVVERGESVGGNAASFEVGGLRVDYGSHRLHPSCAPEILSDIRGMLGANLLDRPRHGRIRLRGRWVHFPLKPADLAMHLPPAFLAGVAADSLRKMAPGDGADTFAAVLERGLGRTICRDFYFPYARKIWGVDPELLDPEQARRRVSAGSLWKMARKALNSVPGFRKPGGGRFYYPRSGFGAISEAYAAAAADAGARILFRTSVAAVETSDAGLAAVRVAGPGGSERIEVRQALSTIPISQLVRLIQPEAPPEVLASACALKFRAMILIYLVLEAERFTEFDAHYFPDAAVAITRLSEPKNYGLAEAPGRTVLCAELPCSVEDPIWRAGDAELQELMSRALEAAGLPLRAPVRAIATRRLAQAYPIYTRDYREHFDRIDAWVGAIPGLVTFGRQGLFAHDNTHHALAMAYALDGCLDDQGRLDRSRWENCRREFRSHVVED
jgi:protoporphyrinogen oxidase